MLVERPASPLWQGIRDGGMATLAVMGMSKNTGKTVALNRLLACAAAEDVAVGLTSIGRDGEALDQVFSIPKPPVVVWPGALVATARDTLQRARARGKMIDGSGIDSPMGEIVFVKVLDAGDMEVAGVGQRAADPVGNDGERVGLVAQGDLVPPPGLGPRLAVLYELVQELGPVQLREVQELLGVLDRVGGEVVATD